MSVPLATILGHIWPLLNAVDESDVVFTSAAELQRTLEFWQKKLADTYGIFIVRDTATITLVNGTQTYSLPDRCASVMHVAINGRPLVATSTNQLEALDDSFQTTAETAAKPTSRFFLDKSGANIIGFHPVPTTGFSVGQAVEVIFAQYACDLSAGIDGPLPIVDWLEIQTIGEARRHESDFSMPECAQACSQLADLYSQAMTAYFGKSQ